ncbi:hypothetical protein PtA15_10A325 [Puccinia triticina]|uniref:Uncharacterized protein n=1 Tax=Puccinia triticina TaxID=208348 RepID=A0ABY7CX28_9BASI|nr:uncharacterized protein PtA15_10A325 [Puccinia triticina]WAQ88903.1 hypothetical protein PtA15_10A325 [Puccinia triticina]
MASVKASFQTTLGSSDSHLTYPEPDAQRRKKFKPSIDLLVQPGHLPKCLSTLEARRPSRTSRCTPGTASMLSRLLASSPASIPSSSPTRIPPPPEQLPLPVFPSDATGPHDSPPLGETDPMCRPAKKAAKLVKATHIMSKQRRRNSGISIATPDPPPPGSSATPMSEQNNAKKPKTGSRGRRGKIKTGASKFVILKRAAKFVVWMTDYNSALSSEISCLKKILLSHHIQV